MDFPSERSYVQAWHCLSSVQHFTAQVGQHTSSQVPELVAL